MKTSFVRTVTSDSLRMDGLLFEPSEKSNRVVLHVHGMAGSFYENEFLDAMAVTYTQAGFALLTGNNRGCGYVTDFRVVGEIEKYRRVGQAFERFEECSFDIQAWCDLLVSQGYKKVILQGHSLGCVKVVYFQYAHPQPCVTGLVLASPPDMLGYVRLEKEYFERDMQEAQKLVSEGKGNVFLSRVIRGWCYKSASSYLDLFADGSKADVFPILRGGEFTELSSITVPIFAFYGGTDDAVIFSPAKDLGIIASHFGHPQSKSMLIGDASHSYFGHEKVVAREVSNFLGNV